MGTMGWLIAILIALFLLGQFAFLYRSKGMQGRPAPDFSALLTAQQDPQAKFVLYFFSPRCSMCKQISATLESLQSGQNNVLFIDVGQQTEIAKKFRVMGTPTLIRVEKGLIKQVMMGAKDEDTVRGFVTH